MDGFPQRQRSRFARSLSIGSGHVTDHANHVATPAGNMHFHRPEVIPSLDGIRAVSVLIVVLGHSGLQTLVPGGLGVTVFFFLSGYLISTLMLTENERTGGIDIFNFYARRVFRAFST
jgi:peptidoglycan/LPS O-acetylase OafA/YrhL